MTPWEELKRRMSGNNEGGDSTGKGSGTTGSSHSGGSGKKTAWQDYKERMKGEKQKADFLATATKKEPKAVTLPKLSYPKTLSVPTGDGYFSYPGEQIQKDRTQFEELYRADNEQYLSGVKDTVAPYYIQAMEDHRASQQPYQNKGYPGISTPKPVTDLETHIEPTEDYYDAAIKYAKEVLPYGERAGKTAQAAYEYEKSVGEISRAWEDRLRKPEEVRKDLDALPDENFVGPTKQGLLEEELNTGLYLAYEDSYKNGEFDLLGLSKTVVDGTKRIAELEQSIKEDQYTLENWPGANDGNPPSKEMLEEQGIVSRRIARNQLELARLRNEVNPKSEEYNYYLGRIFADEKNDPEAESLIAEGKRKHKEAMSAYNSYLSNMPEYNGTLALTPDEDLSRALAPYRKEARSHYPLAVMIEGLSEEDQNTFYYLIGRGLDKLALQFADESSYADRKDQQAEIRQWAGKNFGTGLLASAGSILLLPYAWSDPLLAEGSTSATGLSHAGVGFGGIRDNWRAGVSENLNEKVGTISGNVPVLGDKGLGDLYQLGMSMADSYLSGIAFGKSASFILGGSAFSSGYNQAIDKGVDPETAMMQGAAQGMAEVIFEYVSLDKLFSESGGSVLKNVLSQGGIEASEETCTSLANFFTDRWIMGGKSEYELSVKAYMEEGLTEEEARKKATWDFVENTAADAFGGFFSGGGMSAIHSGATKIFNAKNDQINRANELLGKVDENTDAYTILRALHTVGVPMTEDNRVHTMNELMEQGMSREDAQQLTEVAQKAVEGKRLTSREKALLQKESPLSQMLRTNLQSDTAGTATSKQPSLATAMQSEQATKMTKAEAQADLDLAYDADNDIDLYEAYKDLFDDPDAVADKGVSDTKNHSTDKIKGADSTNDLGGVEEPTTRVKTVLQGEFEATTDGKTHLADDGSIVTIEGIAKVETGKDRNQVYLNVVDEAGNRQTVPGDDLDYGSRDEMLIYEGFGQLGISADYFPEFLEGYRHQQKMGGDMSIGEYALYFEEAVFYGRHGMRDALERSALSADAKNTAYSAGQELRSQIKKQSRQQKSDIATAKKKGQGKVHKKGQVHMPKNMPAKLSNLQKAGVKVAERLASFGMEVHLYRSTLNENGQWVNDRGEVSPNGYYVLEDGSIHVDLNAGAGGRGLMVYTLAHEITHFMARHNAEGFQTLADLLVEWYEGKGVHVEDLVRAQMEEHGYSREVAFEEVVARSCESFLTDSDILVKLTELKQKHSKLYNQIRETVLKFVEWMRRLFRDIDPDSLEGRMLHEAKGTIDHIYEAFTSGMSGAMDTYQWIGAQKNTTDEGGVMYSVREGMTEEQRYNELKDRKISIVSGTIQDEYISPLEQLDNIPEKAKSKAEKIIIPLAEQLGILNKTMKTPEIDIDFVFSKNKGLKESLSKQLRYGGSYRDFANALINLDSILENAVLIEVHKDKYEGTSRENRNLEAVYVLFGAFKTDKYIIPVQSEIKKVIGSGGRLYMTVAMTKIEAGVLGSADNKNRARSLIPTSITCSIAEIFRNINPSEKHFLKYLPDAFLTEKQKTGKYEALREDAKRIAGYSDTKYLEAVKSGDMETAQRMVDERAKRAGYTIRAYHGTENGDFTVFDYSKIGTSSKVSLLGDGFYFADSGEVAAKYGKKAYDVYLKLQNPYMATAKDLYQLDSLALEKAGYDGVEISTNNGKVYMVLDNRQIKSADPVTYDDNGNVIPLSERFNSKNTDIRYAKRGNGSVYSTLMSMEPALVENRGEQKLLERYQADSKKRSAEVQRQQQLEAELSRLEESEKPDRNKIEEVKAQLIRSYNLTETLDQRMIAAEAKLKSLAEGNGRLGKTADSDLLTMSPEALRDRVAQVEQQLADSYIRQDELTQQRDHAKAQSHRSTGPRINRKGLFTFTKELMRKNGAESLATDRVKAKTDELGQIFDKAAEIHDRLGAEVADTYILLSVEGFARDLTESGTLSTDTIALDVLAEAKRLMEGSRLHTVMDQATARYEDLLRQKDQRLEEQKRKAVENEEKIVAKYREARAKSVEGRKKTVVRNKIRKNLQELNTLLSRGNKKKNVKNGMQDVAASLLAYGDVLFSSENNVDPETMVRNGIMTDLTDEESKILNEYVDLLEKRDGFEKRIAAIEKHRQGDWVARAADLKHSVDVINRRLAKADKSLNGVFQRERARMSKITFSSLLHELTASYKALENAQDAFVRGAYISQVYDRLVAMESQESGTYIKDMSLSQLEDLYNAVKMVMTSVKNANKLFREGKAETLAQMVDRVQNEIRALYRKRGDPNAIGGKITDIVSSFVWNELKPYYAFDRIGSEGLMELFWDVIKAESGYGLEISEAGTFIEHLRRDRGYKEWDMDTVTTFQTEDGLEFKVTLGDMMSIYAYSRRDQAFKHMSVGGFVFNVGQEYKDNSKKFLGKKRVRNADMDTYRMTDGLLHEIIDTLSPEQKAYTESMQDYLTKLGEKGNEVSRQLYGIDLFKEKFYFPLKSSADFRSSAEQQLGATQTTASLVNTGMAKETVPNASNPIVLERFDDVAIRHIDQMLKYHNYVLPIENLRKVMDYTVLNEDTWDASVKRMLKAVYGQGATSYLEQWITDLNGGANDGGVQNPLSKFFARSKKVAVAGNLSVVVQQYFSITRAASEINPKYFAPFKGSEAGKSEQRQWEELKQWAGVAVIKEMGGFDMGSARTAQDYIGNAETKTGIIDAVDNAMMWGASKMDELGWGTIWRAVKKEVADTKGLTPGTEEFFKAAGERFTEVIVKTQVYDSVTARSGFMRSKRDSVKYLVSFLGEPTTIVNMMFSSQAQLVRAQRFGTAAEKKQALAKCCRTGTVLVFSSVLGCLAKSLVYAMRDDEETESLWERYWKQFGMALRSDMNPMGMIPVGRDILSLLEGWDVERPDMGLINDFIVALRRAINGDKSLENWTNFTLTVFNLMGMPVKNVVRDGKAFVRLYGDITDDLEAENGVASFWRGFSDEERSKDEILYEAVVNGQTGKLEKIKEGYYKEYKRTGEKVFHRGEYVNAVRKALRVCDPRIHEAALARIDGDITAYMNIAKEIKAEGHFSQDDIVGAINSEISAIRAQQEGKEPSEPSTPPMYTAEDYMASALDEPDTAEAVRGYIIDRYVMSGKTEADAESAFYGDVRATIKEDYQLGAVDYGTAYDYLTRFGGSSENDAYWLIDKWDYSIENGSSDGYSKYNDFFSAVETGDGLREVIDLYVSKGVDPKTMASQITSHFKPIYISATATERKALKKLLVKAYTALGYDRSDDIDRWLKS